MPTETQKQTKDVDRAGCRLDSDILRKARTIAALENMGIAEVLERDLRAPIQRRFEKATAKAAAELSETGV